MPNLILIDVQYSQKAVFSFEKGLNGQNHSSSGSHHPVKKIPPSKISDYRSPPPPPTPYRYLENPACVALYSLNIERDEWCEVVKVTQVF